MPGSNAVAASRDFDMIVATNVAVIDQERGADLPEPRAVLDSNEKNALQSAYRYPATYGKGIIGKKERRPRGEDGAQCVQW